MNSAPLILVRGPGGLSFGPTGGRQAASLLITISNLESLLVSPRVALADYSGV